MTRRSTKNLTEGNLYKNFLLFALPIILSTILSQTFELVDMFVAGRFIGDVALGATGAVSSVLSLFNASFYGFGVGLGVYAAQIFGSADYAKLKQVVYTTTIVMFGALFVVSGLLILLREPIFRFMKVDAELYHDAMIYYVIMMSAKCITTLAAIGHYILNAMGNSSFPFRLSLVSAVMNLVGNIVTVSVFGWGIMGLALSSVVAGALVTVLYAVKVLACLRELGVAGEKFRFSPHHLPNIFRYALPSMIQQMAMYSAVFVQSPLINGLGKAATVSYALCNKFIDIIGGVYSAGARTVSNYIAQCVGAGKIDRISRGMRLGFLQGFVYTAPPFLLCFFAAGPISSIFFPSGYTGEALDIAIHFTRVFLWAIVFNMFNNLFHGFYRGLGAMYMLIASTAVGSVMRIATGYALAPRMGMDGVFLSLALTWFGEMLFSMIVYFTRYRNEDMLRRHCFAPAKHRKA